MGCNTKKAVEISKKMFTKYWNGNNPIFDRWNIIDPPSGRDEDGNIKSEVLIEKLLDDGHSVKAGHTSSGVRGFHNYYILWR